MWLGGTSRRAGSSKDGSDLPQVGPGGSTTGCLVSALHLASEPRQAELIMLKRAATMSIPVGVSDRDSRLSRQCAPGVTLQQHFPCLHGLGEVETASQKGLSSQELAVPTQGPAPLRGTSHAQTEPHTGSLM